MFQLYENPRSGSMKVETGTGRLVVVLGILVEDARPNTGQRHEVWYLIADESPTASAENPRLIRGGLVSLYVGHPND